MCAKWWYIVQGVTSNCYLSYQMIDTASHKVSGSAKTFDIQPIRVMLKAHIFQLPWSKKKNGV